MRIGSSAVDVVSDRIIVRPSFADILCCRAIPGGAWDRSRKAYSFPATAASAKLLRNSLKAFRATPAFDALLTTAPASDAAPVAPERRPPIQEQDPPLALPDGLRTRPWRHQIAALRFCFEKFAAGLRGILLAMGMGTGKSLVALILLLYLRARRVFIASPLRVVTVWLTQFERHVSAEFVVVALDEEAGSVAKKAELANQKMKLAETRGVPFVCIVNYDSAWREPFAAWAEKQRWDVVILDEAHRIKAPGGKASLFFKRLRKVAAYRIALTGTPMPHGPMDIYAIFRFLDITIFGPSFSSFRAKYAVMGGYQRKQITGFQHLEELEALMARNTFRIGKEVLDLPPATHVTYYCELGPEARRVYKDLDDDFVAEYLNGLITAANALVKLTRLQQVANGVVKTENGIEHRIDDSKKKLLSDTLEDIGGDEPVVVFCRYHLDLDAVHEACKAVGLESLELSGRRDELARWQDGEGQVLAVQISAGGIGVDLTRARFSIYYSLSFSLGDYDQSLSRIHRPGQTRPVEHIHLVARNTVDVKIMRALEKRAEIIESILAEINSQQAEDLK